MSAQDGGPAFPNPALADESFCAPFDMSGMSLRDWFAGQALAGMMSNCDASGQAAWLPDPAAKTAYEVADAMIAARGGK